MKYLLLTIFAISFVGACSHANTGNPSNVAVRANTASTPASKDIPYPAVERISLADAKADFDAGNAVFIDTHSEQSFAAEHITGAINVPSNKLDEKIDTIPKGKKIIAYCS